MTKVFVEQTLASPVLQDYFYIHFKFHTGTTILFFFHGQQFAPLP